MGSAHGRALGVRAPCLCTSPGVSWRQACKQRYCSCQQCVLQRQAAAAAPLLLREFAPAACCLAHTSPPCFKQSTFERGKHASDEVTPSTGGMHCMQCAQLKAAGGTDGYPSCIRLLGVAQTAVLCATQHFWSIPIGIPSDLAPIAVLPGGMRNPTAMLLSALLLCGLQVRLTKEPSGIFEDLQPHNPLNTAALPPALHPPPPPACRLLPPLTPPPLQVAPRWQTRRSSFCRAWPTRAFWAPRLQFTMAPAPGSWRMSRRLATLCPSCGCRWRRTLPSLWAATASKRGHKWVASSRIPAGRPYHGKQGGAASMPVVGGGQCSPCTATAEPCMCCACCAALQVFHSCGVVAAARAGAA